MNISLQNVGKRFNADWIFRNLDHEFNSAEPCVILGTNGSGKSTLLQLIAGNLTPTEGAVKWSSGGHKIAVDDIFSHLTLAAPYLELPEEFTWSEVVHFHSRFKPFQQNMSTIQVLEKAQLEHAANKQLKQFSSGMKQRAKLALAILSNSPLLLLDEPCSNLDKQAIEWYHLLMAEYTKDRLVIVCSNEQNDEYDLCTTQLRLTGFHTT